MTLRQRRRPRVAEAGAHPPREQNHESEKVSDQHTKTHLRFASLAVPKDDRYFFHPESPLGVYDQFKSNLEPGGVSLALDKRSPIRRKKSRQRIVEAREWPRQQTGHPRHEAPPPGPARSASARCIPTTDDHVLRTVKKRRDEIANPLRRMAQIGIHDENPARSCRNGAGQYRTGQAPGRALAPQQTDRLSLAEKKDAFAGFVSRTVVDNQYFDLERRGALLEYSGKQRLDVGGFIERRDDDGELFRHGVWQIHETKLAAAIDGPRQVFIVRRRLM